MTPSQIAFELPGQLTFVEGPGGLPFIEIQNVHASARVSLYGGQVLSFVPQGKTDLMFLSKKAYYQTGKAIKGGVPVCWPWFGADPQGLSRSAHGFARNSLWQVWATGETPSGETTLTLGLTETPDTLKLWPHAFKLALNITVGSSLRLTLTTQNTGDQPMAITQALHTYFAVGDIARTTVNGLDGVHYIDKAAGAQSAVRLQTGPVTVASEVDRIYTQTPSEMTVSDAAQTRTIDIHTSGSHTAVVWNPWEKIAAGMADLEPNDYHHFVCVETANAADDVVHLAPGQSHTLMAQYSVT
jgi:glucose-6-phosphate 1-epimerase